MKIAQRVEDAMRLVDKSRITRHPDCGSYGLTTLPSARRTVSHAPPNAYSLNGHLAANSSSTSMPSPGFPLGHM